MLAAGSITFASAQSNDNWGERSDRFGNYNEPTDNLGRSYDFNPHRNVYNYGSHGNAYNYPSRSHHGWYDQEGTRREKMTAFNHGYKGRYEYPQNRPADIYQRDRRIHQSGSVRREKTKSFVGGAVAGAVGKAWLGSALSH